MTNFTRKSQAISEIATGKGQIGVANKGRSQFGFKLSNKARLDLARSGAKALVSGTIKSNRIKQGLSPIKRPPASKKKRQE